MDGNKGGYQIPTFHEVCFADCRQLLKKTVSETIQLVVTSPPYWTARDYQHKLQIGFSQNFDQYAKSLAEVWEETVRTLVPDGKIAVNIGNMYYNKPGEKRKTTANLMNLIWNQLDSLEDIRFMGILYWKKSTSRNKKVLMGSYPYPSNFLISTSLEAIFLFRKIGKRKVKPAIKRASMITKEEFRVYREPLWRINGIYNGHPAAFPCELPRRLIKMYSFIGDTVLDPFLGSGTTTIEAAKLGRNSIGIEVNKKFLGIIKRMIFKNRKVLGDSVIEFRDENRRLMYRFGQETIKNGRD